VNPDDMIKEFGTDPVRLYEMFMGPWNQAIAWETRTLVGLKRFIEKIEKLYGDPKKMGEKTSPLLAAKLAKLLEQVEHGITEQKFNTAIAGCMEFSNLWREADLVLSPEHAKMFVQILSPFAPLMAQKLWEEIGETGQVAESQWPQLTGIDVGNVMVTIAVQVNGKLRGTVEIAGAKAKDQEYVVAAALANESVKKWIASEPRKVIFVPGKLVSFVV